MFLLAEDETDMQELDQYQRQPVSTIETANFYERRVDKSAFMANG